ncbi:DNA replication regulator SLD3-domain-containing protein [Aspergillus pseudonomiae]|uniref:DNA replication regulator SLD3-domain-containing protein n=1 Tax=Aspergillus pseudonomiae TaxID=1506151 RepID=A0A5N7CYW5_9EURO|nr:DNA replication regulator SLD3-domain-containing protein [Aspergillus pseudonomiae]KAB8253732.1 DNA replication regulator SLD3-domain-containing protein [Aspergillus pseudonomiae]KAE8398738.1 DNA replication regulator SLD3-domain-containing protein [Aspergillus pseudonomiae]
MASRVSSSALDPFSVNPLQEEVTNPTSKKRKTCHLENDWTKQTISIRAHAASLSHEPYVLEPIAIVPRCRLPLSWLDFPPASLCEIQSGSLFIADIPVLENNLRTEPVVLAVRLASDGGLYVVERVKKGIYALSKLARGVEEGDIVVAVKGWNPPGVEQAPRCLSAIEEGGDWWLMAQIDDPVTDPHFSTKRAKFDISVVFGVVDHDVRLQDVSPVDSGESRGQSVVPQVHLERDVSSDATMPTAVDPQEHCGDGVGTEFIGAESLQSPQELLDNLREQYLQALYISKTSVAYFAKGPLARCRTAFQSSELGSSQPSELSEFYREAVLTAKKMDLKYRETLPSTLKDVALSISDDESTLKKKRKNKKKLGKNGLYPTEEQFIRTWWKARAVVDQGVSTETSRDVELKKHVADLRLRETQLQILLILETMALEAAMADEAKSTEEGVGSDKTTVSKPKKLQDLQVMLELHLDRLCIWHAVSFDDVAVSDPNKVYGDNESGGKKVESDAVRDFCTEVIVPFYASRLPDKCKSITRKLGVPSVLSPFPKKPPPKNVPRAEPGAAVERQPSQKHPRRTLQRVLTDEQTASQGRRLSLSRFNTMPSQSERESMEPLLPSLSSNVRGGIQKAKRVDNREVDLNAVARQHETKLRKMQMLKDQKKELDAAIHALRKPNRELVAKDIAEDAEKRRTGGSARKPKNPVRNPFGEGVQVAATPKGSRKRNAIIGMPPLPRGMPMHSSTQPQASSFFGGDGSPVVPASTTRTKSFSIASSSRDTNAIQDTPTRRPTQPFGPFDGPGAGVTESPLSSGNLFRVPRRPVPRSTDMAPTTPVPSRRTKSRPDMVTEPTSSLVMETPPRQNPPLPLIQTDGPAEVAADTPAKVLGTPVKGSSARLSVPTTTAVPVTPEKSIYAHLGWDDDDDLGL